MIIKIFTKKQQNTIFILNSCLRNNIRNNLYYCYFNFIALLLSSAKLNISLNVSVFINWFVLLLFDLFIKMTNSSQYISILMIITVIPAFHYEQRIILTDFHQIRTPVTQKLTCWNLFSKVSRLHLSATVNLLMYSRWERQSPAEAPLSTRAPDCLSSPVWREETASSAPTIPVCH